MQNERVSRWMPDCINLPGCHCGPPAVWLLQALDPSVSAVNGCPAGAQQPVELGMDGVRKENTGLHEGVWLKCKVNNRLAHPPSRRSPPPTKAPGCGGNQEVENILHSWLKTAHIYILQSFVIIKRQRCSKYTHVLICSKYTQKYK